MSLSTQRKHLPHRRHQRTALRTPVRWTIALERIGHDPPQEPDGGIPEAHEWAPMTPGGTNVGVSTDNVPFAAEAKVENDGGPRRGLEGTDDRGHKVGWKKDGELCYSSSECKSNSCNTTDTDGNPIEDTDGNPIPLEKVERNRFNKPPSGVCGEPPV